MDFVLKNWPKKGYLNKNTLRYNSEKMDTFNKILRRMGQLAPPSPQYD